MTDTRAANDAEATRDRTRTRIVSATARLLVESGREAVSTRAICAAAEVQAPTIYRLFGDKEGLFDAVAIQGFHDHLASHGDLEPTEDPVADLRTGWDLHVQFGLQHPYLYSLMYGQPHPGSAARSAVLANQVLTGLVRRIAEAGRLGIGVDRAAQLMHAAGCGTVLTLISMPAATRQLGLSETAREAAIAAIVTDPADSPVAGAVSAAVALRAVSDQVWPLTAAEVALLQEWLDRAIEGAEIPGELSR